MKYGFFILFFTLFFGMLAYVLIRGWQALPINHRMIYAASFGSLLTLLMAGLFLENLLPANVSKVVAFAGFTFLIVAVYLFLSFLLVDIVRLVNQVVHFAPSGMHAFRLWAMTGSLVIIALALMVGHYQFNHPEVVKMNLTVDNPLQNKQLKIVAASDIHLGNSIDIKMLRKYVQMINDQQPDIVLLLGDITDRSANPLSEQNMKSVLENIHAPLGVYAIRGNHEFYSGKPDEIAGYLQSSGIHVLIDSAFLVNNSFYVIGRDDRTNSNRKTLKELTQGLDPNIPKILLDHQPYQLEEAQQNKIDLQLSGHTHDGQFFPGNLFTEMIFELGHGYLKKGKTHFYVSSGLGIWGPQFRIGTKSELVTIKLTY